MQQDVLSDALSSINNAARTGNRYAKVSPTSNLIKNILVKLQEKGYIGLFELVEDGKGRKFKVEVKPEINSCKPVKPKFNLGKQDYNEYARRYLPARNFGILLVTTSEGVLTHEEARDKGVGGKLLGYVY